MIRKLLVILPLVALSGCEALQHAGAGDQEYRACVIEQIGVFAAANGAGAVMRDKATAFVIDACGREEQAFVDFMADQARASQGSKFALGLYLREEEANLRGGLHDLAARLVAENL